MKTKLNMFRTVGLSAALAAMAHSGWAASAQGGSNDARRTVGVALCIVLSVALYAMWKATVVAFSLGANELAPALIRKGRGILTASPIKSFLVGLVNVVLAVIIGAALCKVKEVRLLGCLLLLAVACVLVTSRAMIYQWRGMRLTGEVPGPEGTPGVRSHCLGGLAAELAFLLPILGWLADMVINLMTAGALILAMMTRERAAEKQPE